MGGPLKCPEIVERQMQFVCQGVPLGACFRPLFDSGEVCSTGPCLFSACFWVQIKGEFQAPLARIVDPTTRTTCSLIPRPFFGYPILGLGSCSRKVGYPQKGIWYELTWRFMGPSSCL